MKNITNVTLVGVGGQGIILTSDILARAAALSGFDVRKSEIHGMSQRGGSVSSQVRFGKTVHSPIVPDGETDFLVAFELLEAIRCFPMLRATGSAVVDRRDIVPLTVSSGMQPGVDDRDGLVAKLYGDRARLVDASTIAAEIGNVRTANLVLAGALSRLLPFEVEAWHEAMRSRIKESLVAINLKAFAAGRGE
ncbi:MAG: indolepyruvate oxidoreductase subunit beta [Kiritimatiellia bacterium]|jgi:indolepyruvate ferredoxin oxidoreductase beta subunit